MSVLSNAINQLKPFSNQEPRIVEIVDLYETALQIFEQAQEGEEIPQFFELIEKVREKTTALFIRSIINNEEALIQTSHQVLVILAELFPINVNSEIDPKDIIGVYSGEQFNLKKLIEFHNQRKPIEEFGESDEAKLLLNPTTSGAFYFEDARRIQHTARARGLKVLHLIEEPEIGVKVYSAILMALNNEQYDYLPDGLKALLDKYPELMQTLIAKCNVAVKDILSANETELSILDALLTKNEFVFFIKKLGFKFLQLCKLLPSERMEILNHKNAFFILIRVLAIPYYGILRKLDPKDRMLLLKQYEKIGALCIDKISLRGYPTLHYGDLLNLEFEVLESLLKNYNPEDVLKFFSFEAKTNIDFFIELNSEEQLEVLEHMTSITQLLKRLDVDLIGFYQKIPEKQRLQIYKYAHEFCLLLEKFPLDFNLFVMLSVHPLFSNSSQISWAFFRGVSTEKIFFEMLRIIFEKPEMLQWIEDNNADVSLLLNLPINLLHHLSIKLDKISEIVPKYIACDEFLKLTPKFLEQIVNNLDEVIQLLDKGIVSSVKELETVESLLQNIHQIKFH